MRSLLLSVVMLLVCSAFDGCGRLTGAESEDAFLRIRNASSRNFSEVRVSYPGTDVAFTDIGSGQAAAYRRVDAVYSYGAIDVESEGRSYRLQPIDFVGEEPLGSGHFTYVLAFYNDQLTFDLETD